MEDCARTNEREEKRRSIWRDGAGRAARCRSVRPSSPLTSVSSLMTVGRCSLNNVVFAADAAARPSPPPHKHDRPPFPRASRHVARSPRPVERTSQTAIRSQTVAERQPETLCVKTSCHSRKSFASKVSSILYTSVQTFRHNTPDSVAWSVGVNNGYGVGLATEKAAGSTPALRFQVATSGKLFTHVCLCHQAVQFGTRQEAVTPCGWEGDRRSGVALAMRHKLQWFIHKTC